MKPHVPTLADRVIQSAANERFDPYTRAILGGAAKEITAAQRFVLSEDVREAVRMLMTTKPSTLLSATAFARPPFPKIWLEWPTPDQPKPVSDVRVKTTRIGALIDEAAPNAFRFFTVWSYATDDTAERWERLTHDNKLATAVAEIDQAGLGVSTIEAGVDFSGSAFAAFAASGIDIFTGWNSAALKMTDAELQAIRNDYRNGVQYALRSETERQALIDLHKALHWRVRRDRWSVDQLTIQMSFGRQGIEAALDDVRDEVGPVLAMLILMNSRNCVETEKTEPPPKLVKARIKSGKKPPLDYTTVHIKLSKTQSNVANAKGMTHAERRRHLVSGHFKIKKSGVFWWSSHFRGSGIKGTVGRDHYDVSMS